MSAQENNADNWTEETESQKQPPAANEESTFKSKVQERPDDGPRERRPREFEGPRRDGRGPYGDRQSGGRPSFDDRRDSHDRPEGDRRGGYDNRKLSYDDRRERDGYDSRRPSFDDRRPREDSYRREDSRYSDRREDPYRREDSRYSDRREDSYRREDSRYPDRREDPYRREDSRYPDRREDPYRREDSRYPDRREDRFSGYGDEGRKRRPYDDDYQRRDDYDRRPKKTREDPITPNETIGIFNLSYNLTPKDFEDFLDEKLVDFKGKYTQKLVLNRNTGACRGFGFVTFSDINDSIEAKKVIDNGEILGQPYRAAFSVQRGPSGPRDYSGSRPADGEGSQCPVRDGELN